MPNSRRTSNERHPTHPLVEGVRGVLVLIVATAGVALTGWLAAAIIAAVFR
jgi:hypothetical protein